MRRSKAMRVEASLDVAAAASERASDARTRGDTARARREAAKAHARFRRCAGASHPDTASTLALLGALDLDAGNFNGARAKLSRAVRSLEQYSRYRAVRPMLHRAHCDLARTLRELGRYVEARASAERALVIAKSIGSHATIEALNERGMICKYAGWFAVGVRSYRAAVARLEAQSPVDRDALATLLHNQGGIEHARERPAAAVVFARRGLAIRRALDGDDHPRTLADEGALAAILVDLGAYDEAAEMLLALKTKFERAYGHTHAEVAVVCDNLAVLHARQGRFDEALPLARRALRIVRARLGRGHPEAALSAHNLGAVLAALGRSRDARRLFDEAIDVAKRALGVAHPTTRAAIKARRALG